MPTWIKICGTTSIEDALASIEAGANALGFVFAPSRRRVSPKQAREIANRLPGNVERVGVFVNESAEAIRATVEQAGLTAVQLHGEETPEFIAGLFAPQPGGHRARVIKTVLANDNFATNWNLFRPNHQLVDFILIDSGSGSGKTFDWHATHALIADHGLRFIIAGGLDPENVGAAIRKFSPWGVDVVSGVEQAPGRKDPEKLKLFVNAVRKAEQQ
jgi:phosphoribosylanthranilate isomerase